MRNKLYLSTIFLLISFIIKAQEKQQITKANEIIIEGRIVDSLLALTPHKKVNVTLNISEFPFNAFITPKKQYVLQTQNNKFFKFIIPATADRLYMRISFPPQGLKYWSFVDNIYILEKGDKIKCELSADYFKFWGKGSAKLQCQSALFKHKTPILKDPEFKNIKQWNEALDFKMKKEDSVLKQRIETVKKFAPAMGKEITDIMLANCYGMKYYLWLRTERITAWIIASSKNPIISLSSKNLRNTSAYKTMDLDLPRELDAKQLASAPNYCDFLFEKILLDCLENKNDDLDNLEKIQNRVFEKIKSDYEGAIRESLLTMFFLNYKKRQETPAYLDEALTIIKNANYRKLLKQTFQLLDKGAQFYPFELKDNNGNLVRLSDFSTKVILIDFWFTGCSGCITLSNALEPVISKYKSNPNIRFVSVNIDRTETEWRKSIAGGKYTHPVSINLYAGTNEQTLLKDPLITNYNITSCPILYLLKNGKIYSSSPPRPLKSDEKDLSKGNTKELVLLIDKALSE